MKLIDIEWKNCAEYDGGEVSEEGGYGLARILTASQVILLDEVQAVVNGEVSDRVPTFDN